MLTINQNRTKRNPIDQISLQYIFAGVPLKKKKQALKSQNLRQNPQKAILSTILT
jgi:hypothetical protein